MSAAAPLALDDPAARDPAVAGVKAAALAVAADAGLPVLPGWILALEASAAAIAAGARALARQGPPAAYLAAMDAAVLPSLVEPLPLAEELFVVRSSTGWDDDGRWSGAFASYLGIGASDLATAIRGCWASVFSTDVLARCRETGIEIASLRIGVLVQPFQAFEVGGTAWVREDRTVVVTAAPGGPAGVVSGHGGVALTVGVDGRLAEGLGDTTVAASTAEAVAALARRSAETVGGACLIEWGAIGDELSLLQVGPTPLEAPSGAPSSRPATRPGGMPADVERLAQLVTAFPGPVGDDLVLPWALGAGDVPDAERIAVDDPASALREARASAGELVAEVWGTSPEVARECAAAVSRLLLEGRVADGCREIRHLSPPDTATACRVVGLIRSVGVFLADAGSLPSGRLVWRLTVSELEHLIAGDRPTMRRGPGRWEPFVADVVRSRGFDAAGMPVSPGIAAGYLHPLGELRAMGRPGPRDVLVTPLPLPHLAPLLWHCAALVSIGGSSGAHLFEVARSLGVPAVIGVDPTVSSGAGSLVAVDGDAGLVSILPDRGTSRAPSSQATRAMV